MKKVLDKITSVFDKICLVFCYFSMAVCFIMMVLICIDVISQKAGHAISGMYEICQVLLSTVVFASWAYTQTFHGHIHVVMFINKMPQAPRFICFSITSLISTVVLAFGSYSVFNDIFNRYNTGEFTGTLMIPYWPFIIFEAIAFILLTLLLLLDAIKAIYAIGNKEMAAEIQADWV